MPSPYSYDLRSRVIECVKSGMKRKEISRIFNIGTSTIKRWWSRFKIEGDYSARVGFQKGHSHKITNLKEFKDLVNKNSSLTCEELAEEFGDISGETIRRYLKKIGYSRKKVFSIQRTRRRSSERVSGEDKKF